MKDLLKRNLEDADIDADMVSDMKRVTVRLGSFHYEILERYASKVGVTKTRCAEEFLKMVLMDAFKAMEEYDKEVSDFQKSK